MEEKELETIMTEETENTEAADDMESTESIGDMENTDDYDDSDEVIPRESVAYLPKDKADRLAAFLKYSEISDVEVEYDDISDTYDINVLSKDFERAQNLYSVFAANELKDETAPDSEDSIEDKVEVNLYESSTEKYKDNLSSAITFFICGAAGLIILLLNNFGVLHFLTKESSSFILMNIVLGLLFAGFIVIGFLSLKYSKKAKERAEKENDALNKVMDWLTENVSKDDIENSYENTIPDEMKYFNRSEYIKKALKEEFSDMDEATIDFINDKYLEELF